MQSRRAATRGFVVCALAMFNRKTSAHRRSLASFAICLSGGQHWKRRFANCKVTLSSPSSTLSSLGRYCWLEADPFGAYPAVRGHDTWLVAL